MLGEETLITDWLWGTLLSASWDVDNNLCNILKIHMYLFMIIFICMCSCAYLLLSPVQLGRYN
jgi:hypothetical protein